MTTVEQIVRNGLLGYNALTALINDALFLVQLPQNFLGTLQGDVCAVTFQRISSTRIYAHGSANDVGSARFQFTAWAGGKNGGAKVLEVAQRIIEALGTFSAFHTPVSPEVLLAAPNFVLDQRMGVEPQTRPPVFTCSVDARVWFRDQ